MPTSSVQAIKQALKSTPMKDFWMADTMRFGSVGNTMVVLHTAERPNDDEWREMIAFLRTVAGRNTDRIIVYTLGGGPNATQQAAYDGVVAAGNLRIKVAVLNDSRIVRSIIAVFNWFGSGMMRSFPLNGIADAFHYLGIPHEDQSAILDKIQQFSKELGVISGLQHRED